MGALEWQKTLGRTAVDQMYSLQQTADGGYVLGGFSNSNNNHVSGNHGGFDYWVVKLSNIGIIEWQKSFGGTGSDKITAIKQTADGGYILAGQSTSNNNDVTGNHGGADGWIVKVNSLLSLEDSANENKFSVYPIPSSGEIYVDIMENALGLPYAIYDQLGKVVRMGKLKEPCSVIEIDNLSKGIYFLNMGEKFKTIVKIVKE